MAKQKAGKWIDAYADPPKQDVTCPVLFFDIAQSYSHPLGEGFGSYDATDNKWFTMDLEQNLVEIEPLYYCIMPKVPKKVRRLCMNKHQRKTGRMD